jgi:hypothetical protein
MAIGFPPIPGEGVSGGGGSQESDVVRGGAGNDTLNGYGPDTLRGGKR